MIFSQVWIKLLGTGVVFYTALCIGLFCLQTRLIFRPSPTVALTPAEIPVDYQELWIDDQGGLVSENQGLHGWWLPSQGNLANQSLTLLYLHGNAGNIGSNLGLAHRYQRMGFNVLLVDYRGYGRSGGPFPNETRVYEDAIAAYRYLTETRGIPQQQLWIFGHSLGGAIAINLVSQRPAAGLIVQSSFSSMLQVVNLNPQYRWFPVKWLLTQRFDSLSKVPQLQLPVLYIHGLADDTIVSTMSEQLWAASPQPKQLWLVPGANHNDVSDIAGTAYFTIIETFVQQMQSTVSIQPPRSPVE